MTAEQAERYRCVAETATVNERISEMASDIIQSAQGTSPLFVALLRGAAPFSGKLMFEIARQAPNFHPDIDYMMVSTYGNQRHASEPHIVTDLAPSTTVNGRTVIIIDDVLDKGITADFVTKHLIAGGANAVSLAALCDKSTTRERDVSADYVGFTFEDAWLVGMGMDDTDAAHEGYRWLDAIWQVTQ